MAENLILVDRPRIGWFYDGLPNEFTPDTATLLMDDGKRITLTIPWHSSSAFETLERWFSNGHVVYVGPDGELPPVKMPSEIAFVDVDGRVLLVGCTPGGYTTNFGGTNTGRGIVNITLAVLGTDDLRFGRVNGVRTDIPELGEWMGLSSITPRDVRDSSGRIDSLTLTFKSPSEVPLSRRLNLRAVPDWKVVTNQYGPQSMHDDVVLESSASRALPWEEHLRLHQAFREVLDMCAWEPFGYRSMSGYREDDTSMQARAQVPEPLWRPAKTYAVRSAQTRSRRPRYWFGWQALGTRGFHRWLRVREKYSRGTIPILNLLDVQAANLEVQVLQSCLGLEAIGYQIALDSGMSSRKANYLRFSERLKLILAEIPFEVVLNDWPDRASEVYNGIKHANRPLPAPTPMDRIARENVLVFRSWVFLRLGVARSILQQAVEMDSSAQNLKNSDGWLNE